MSRRPTLSTHLALAAIRGYQRWLSPRKGFTCALRSATGGASCSAYGYQVIGRFGLQRGLGLLRRRLDLCGHVHGARTVPRHPVLYKQRGNCDMDLPCDGQGCAADGADVAGCAYDLLGSPFSPGCCGDSSCWSSRTASRPIRDPGKRNAQHLDALAARVREQQEARRRKTSEQEGGDRNWPS